ncbi:MAG: hypothetical protein DRJ42_28050 [Deltaproteobacteria bacterium]|nr:MAG: hypothetical protein DRJ42_28050 [Deltaproteobacteria bacterium]
MWLDVLLLLLLLLLPLLLSCNSVESTGEGVRADGGGGIFETEILPLLERRCATDCHGIDASAYERFVEEPENRVGLFFPVDPETGRIADDPAVHRRVYEVLTDRWPPSEGADHGGGAVRIDRQADRDFSLLLRAPLSLSLGGLPHRGLDLFASPDDPDLATLRSFVEAEIAAHPEAAPPETPAATFFREQVVGVLERNGCMLLNCHGPNVFNDLKLALPLPRTEPGEPARLSPRMLAANRRALRGNVCRLVNLGGDLRLSRVIVKNLPIEEGGVHQRGGNQQFFESYDDPDVQTLLEWMRLERDELTAKLTIDGEPVPQEDLGRLQGVAFLRGTRHAPRAFFDADAFWPGTRLMMAPEDGTEPFEIAGGRDAEIQSFDVRYDARAIVFSMRASADEGYRLYEVELDGDLRPTSLRPLSQGPARTAAGQLVHHIDPIYIPGPGESEGTALDDVGVAFVSNAAGEQVASEAWALLGEADEGSSRTTLLDLQRVEHSGTFDGRRLHVVDGPLEGEWRRITRHAPGGRLVLDHPLPSVPDARTVYVIEPSGPRYRSAFDVWRMIPSRPFEETARRMTFTNAQERRPTMRTSGEVMATSVRNRGWQGDRPVFNGAIYRMQAGGFDYHIQGGNRSRYPIYADSRELPSGLEIRLALDPRNLWGGGSLILADHGFGVNLEPDNPMDTLAVTSGGPRPESAAQRFLPTHLPLLPEQGPDATTHTGVSASGSFRDHYPLPDGRILVAHTPASIDHLAPTSDPDWDIHWLRFPGSLQSVDGLSAGRVELSRIDRLSSTEWAEFNPRPVIVRLQERARTHQKFVPGTETERIDGVERAAPDAPAEIECYDYPLLASFLDAFAPVGARDIRHDEMRWVRIVRQIPPVLSDTRPVEAPGPPEARDPFATPVSLGVHERQEIVAEIPLEPDGSFYARVPTEVPLIVQGLDSERRALHSMNRWFYLQPGEKLTFAIPRSVFPMRCAGCHGSLTGDRADALGAPDVVSAASRVMANWNAAEARRRRPHEEQPSSPDYRRDVQPIFDRHCSRCHGAGGDAPGGLDLRGDPQGAYTASYVSLLALEEPASGNQAARRWVNEREGLSSESHLIEVVSGQELAAPRALETPGIPHPAEDPLDADELLTLTRWIDLGATFLGAGSR